MALCTAAKLLRSSAPFFARTPLLPRFGHARVPRLGADRPRALLSTWGGWNPFIVTKDPSIPTKESRTTPPSLDEEAESERGRDPEQGVPEPEPEPEPSPAGSFDPPVGPPVDDPRADVGDNFTPGWDDEFYDESSSEDDDEEDDADKQEDAEKMKGKTTDDEGGKDEEGSGQDDSD